MKYIIPFILVFLLLFCGCTYKDRANQPGNSDDGLYEKLDELDSHVHGGVITIHTPDESDDFSQTEGDNLSNVDSIQSPEDVPDHKTAEIPEEKPDHSAQVPIYPVDGDENFGSSHIPSNSDDMPDGAANHTDVSQDEGASPEDDDPAPGSMESTVNVTAYTMDTVYENDAGESILELRIDTPVIETKASEAERLFNRYYSTKALEYALYVNETLFPEVKVSQAVDAEPQISSAKMEYSVLYNDDGYLCVLTSYTEILAERREERADAALFDMSVAALLDEWEVRESSDVTLETILGKINTVSITTGEDSETE